MTFILKWFVHSCTNIDRLLIRLLLKSIVTGNLRHLWKCDKLMLELQEKIPLPLTFLYLI